MVLQTKGGQWHCHTTQAMQGSNLQGRRMQDTAKYDMTLGDARRRTYPSDLVRMRLDGLHQRLLAMRGRRRLPRLDLACGVTVLGYVWPRSRAEIAAVGGTTHA